MNIKRPIAETSRVEETYLSLRSLAVYANLSVRTLREYLTHPLHPLPHLKLPGKILVKKLDFDCWIEQFRVASTETLSDVVDHVVEALR
jgi:hypothetical protein